MPNLQGIEIKSGLKMEKKGILACTSFGASTYSVRICLKGIARETVYPSCSKNKLNGDSFSKLGLPLLKPKSAVFFVGLF